MSSPSGYCQFDRIPFDLIKGVAFDQERPGGSRKFVGKRSNHDALRSPGQQRIDPPRSLTSGNDDSSAVHQRRSDISIPTFGDSHLSDLASSTCLPERQSKPCGKLSSRVKARAVGGCSYQNRCHQGANRRNGLQGKYLLVLLAQRHQALFDTHSALDLFTAVELARQCALLCALAISTKPGFST